jgi:hypothetical protein
MAEQSRIRVSWTPSADAVSQRLYRADSSAGPWTLLALLNATASTYLDTTTDPTPHKTYYYKVQTVCSGGTTTDSAVQNVVCKNCPTQGTTYLFGLRNLSTQPGNYLDFTYYSGHASYLNGAGYSAAQLDSTQTVNPVISVSSNNNGSAYKHIVCQKCGEEITKVVNSFSAANGATNNNGDFSYLSNQNHIASYLPTPPSNLGGDANGNLGSVYRKLFPAGAIANTGGSGRFRLGIGSPISNTFVPWYGGYVQNNANVPTGTANPINIQWNFGNMPTYTSSNNGGFTQIQIDRNTFVTSGSSVNQSTGLASLTGSNVYMSIIDEYYTGATYYGGALKCEHYLYKLTRKPSYDVVDNGTIKSYGFSMVKYSNLTHNQTYIAHSPADNDFFPYPFNDQPNVYLKLFTL